VRENCPIAEQSGKQRKCMIRLDGIDEWFLPFQRFRRAATRLVISVELRSDDLWEKFRDSAPKRLAPVTSIQWLPENKLATSALLPRSNQ
jgi:hypothetical protein